MGANQSTRGSHGTVPGGGAEAKVKRCYYDLLDVPRNATEDECVLLAAPTWPFLLFFKVLDLQALR